MSTEIKILPVYEKQMKKVYLNVLSASMMSSLNMLMKEIDADKDLSKNEPTVISHIRAMERILNSMKEQFATTPLPDELTQLAMSDISKENVNKKTVVRKAKIKKVSKYEPLPFTPDKKPRAPKTNTWVIGIDTNVRAASSPSLIPVSMSFNDTTSSVSTWADVESSLIQCLSTYVPIYDNLRKDRIALVKSFSPINNARVFKNVLNKLQLMTPAPLNITLTIKSSSEKSVQRKVYSSIEYKYIIDNESSIGYIEFNNKVDMVEAIISTIGKKHIELNKRFEAVRVPKSTTQEYMRVLIMLKRIKKIFRELNIKNTLTVHFKNHPSMLIE